MITIGLDLEPGQVAQFEVAGRRYALVAAPLELPGVIDSGRLTSRVGGRYQTRQLADRTGDDLPDGIRIEQKGPYCWVVYDGGQSIGWAGDRETAVEKILEPYLAESVRRARTRDGLARARQRY
jgi:hypothetical protein